MQITQVGQYNKNSGQPVGKPVPSTAVTSLSASVRDLLPGSIFEGNISYAKGGSVILSLENGQNIHARLDKNAAKLTVGESMFFQVKSNEDGVVAIRPYMGDGSANPTLMRALQAAGLPINERNLQMVNEMMKQQLPIHADALGDMHRVVVANENIRVDTLVQMKKQGLSITPQLATQFENYRSDTHQLLDQMQELTDTLPSLYESAESVEDANKSLQQFVNLHDELIGVLTEDTSGEPFAATDTTTAQTPAVTANTAGEPIDTQLQLPPLSTDTDEPQQARGLFLDALAGEQGEMAKSELTAQYAPGQLGAVLDAQTQEDFSNVLRAIGELSENEVVFDEEGDLNLNLSTKDMLRIINQELTSQLGAGTLEADDVRELLSDKGYQRIFSQALEEQWLLTPEEVGSKEKVEKLYERLNRQLQEISAALSQNGREHTSFSHAVTQLSDNIEFMNQLNTVYNYIQLPLKLSGQDANGELYVYTNKRNLQDTDGELTAFLHLDLEHLGPTDVSVRMRDKQVKTNFVFADEESLELVEQFLPVLDEKLTALGYNVTLTVGEQEPQTDSMAEFLKKDRAGGSVGIVHRYSFDVRA